MYGFYEFRYFIRDGLYHTQAHAQWQASRTRTPRKAAGPKIYYTSPADRSLGLSFTIFDHPRSSVVYNFGRVWLSVTVCSLSLSVVCLSDHNFRKTWRRKFIFAHPVYLQGIRVKLIYESHRIKIKVTSAKKVDTAYSHNVTQHSTTLQFDPGRLNSPSSITPLL